MYDEAMLRFVNCINDVNSEFRIVVNKEHIQNRQCIGIQSWLVSSRRIAVVVAKMDMLFSDWVLCK